jgi:Subtilase family
MKTPMQIPMQAPMRTASMLALSLAAILAAPSSLRADVFTDIRYTDLVARLGAATPTGAGIAIGQVEAPENAAGSYAPDTALGEFSGKTISLLSGTGLVPSWHATEVAKNLYGNTLSIARGVTNIYSWQVNPWLTTGYLRVGSGGAVGPVTPPAGVRVFNHSWIGSFGSAANDNDALRRLDLTVTRDNLFIAAGTNNGAGSAAQPMMAYAFNAITVGLADGNHANALTPAGIDGPSRRKPDIVAPGQFTSFSTPVVGAAAALLFDAADSDPAVSANANANRPLTVKAVLMAGATHRATWSNGAPTSGPSRGITATPLDPVYGADLLNIDRAHRIFTGGEANGSTIVLPTTFTRHQGWDHVQSVAAGASVHWSFRVHQPVDEVSVVATWHRQVATNFTTWNMQDLDLRLMKLVGGVPTAISGDAGAAVFASGNCESASLVDNAEHLYLRNLAAGDYVLQLTRKAGTQSALPVVVAWYMPDTTVTGDLDGDGLVGASDIATLLNQWGGPGSGDLNGNGIVEGSDIAILLSNWG